MRRFEGCTDRPLHHGRGLHAHSRAHANSDTRAHGHVYSATCADSDTRAHRHAYSRARADSDILAPTATPTPAPTCRHLLPRPRPRLFHAPLPTATPAPTATPIPQPLPTATPAPTATSTPAPTATPIPRALADSDTRAHGHAYSHPRARHQRPWLQPCLRPSPDPRGESHLCYSPRIERFNPSYVRRQWNKRHTSVQRWYSDQLGGQHLSS